MAGRLVLSRRHFLSTGVAAAGLSFAGVGQASTELVVIVHRENAQQLSASDIEAIFRTTLRHWPGGNTIVAFNLAPGSAERVTFDRAALRLAPDNVSRYWIDRRIRGGHPPPRAVPNPSLVARLVGELRAGIGYVPAALVHPGVRVAARVQGSALVKAAVWPRAVEEL